MILFLVSLFISLNYIAALFYLPFVVPYFDESGVVLLFVFLNIIGYFVMYLTCIAFIYCTKKYIRFNAETTLSFFKQKGILNSIEDISVRQCGNGIWILSVKDIDYTINLTGYIFQKSFIMGIFVRFLYYKYIKNGLQKNFAKYRRIKIRSLSIPIITCRGKIIKKIIVRNYRLNFNLITQSICYYQIARKFTSIEQPSYFFSPKPQNYKVKYTEKWWIGGGF